jgi:S-adenosylmethionine synthetase
MEPKGSLQRYTGIIKNISLNTTIYLDVSARGHLHVGSFGIFREKKCFWQRSIDLQ